MRKSLDKLGYDLVFPTAPHKILAADASNPTEQEKLHQVESSDDEEYLYWGWAFADDEKQEMRGLDKSVVHLTKILQEQVTTQPNTKAK